MLVSQQELGNILFELTCLKVYVGQLFGPIWNLDLLSLAQSNTKHLNMQKTMNFHIFSMK
jgi:hypothetical protein